jgi:hypothetical protein
MRDFTSIPNNKGPAATFNVAGAQDDRITNVLFNEFICLAQVTGLDPEGWREFWRIHGTNWRSLFELHAAIVNRLQANSSLWGSS